MMNAKEYLSQAFYIDKQLKAKVEQLSVLRELATATSQPLSDMPGSPNRTIDRMERSIIKIVDMEKEIAQEVDRLLDLKSEIAQCVKNVEDIDCRLILEFRYLCFMSWEEIAAELNFTVRNIHILHGKALKLVEVP